MNGSVLGEPLLTHPAKGHGIHAPPDPQVTRKRGDDEGADADDEEHGFARQDRTRQESLRDTLP